MKKLLLLALSATILACANHPKNEEKTSDDTSASISSSEKSSVDTSKFDLAQIPLSDKTLGEFPFMQPPTNYCFGFCSSWEGTIRKGDIKEVDKQYFAVAGKLIPIEGKSYSNEIQPKNKFSALEVEKAFNKTITDLGGVLVNEAEIPKSEVERIGDTELITNKHGASLDYNLLDHVKTYVIKTKEKIVWIQFSLMDGESGKITILEQQTS